MDLKLKGKKAIVTGASRGIGLRIARALADEGVDVGICSRTAASVADAVAELKGRGVRAFGDAADVMDPDSYVPWIHKMADQLGGIDIFVSNVSNGPGEAGDEGWYKCFEGDVMGAVRGAETVLPYLRKAEAPSILFIASISGVMSKALRAAGVLAYGSCKAALIAYGAQMAKELAPAGIRVNAVSPGPIYFIGGPWDHIRQLAPKMYDDALEQCVIGRLGTPEEVAAAVVFLASPVSGFTTGQNLHVDGGYMQHIAF